MVLLAAGLVNGQSVEPLRILNGPWIQNLNEKGLTIFFTTNLPVVPAAMASGTDRTFWPAISADGGIRFSKELKTSR